LNCEKFILYHPIIPNYILFENTLEEILFYTSANFVREAIVKPFHQKNSKDIIQTSVHISQTFLSENLL